MIGAGVSGIDPRLSRARIVAASNDVRRRIERDLHDGPQQHLVAMAVKLLLAEQAVDSDPAEAKRMLAELRGEMQATVQQLRDVACAIYPPLLADRGLGEALAAAAARAEVEVALTVTLDGSRRFSAEVEAAVYFSCIEAMQGAQGPLSVWVGEQDRALVFEVRGPVAEERFFTVVSDRTDTLGGTVTGARDGADLYLCGSLPLR
ncbi:MAG: histidine kinase dimerization/phosphoacceptor domain-containing protein [Actinobacteria bacterium]|nr:histidine kinase dimerization/phosphoacceptor domain-containing protein [Actinomycetota bacterium]MBW3649702.1 histidine kinase dimerization/phosphoacceptor domain-containing protein [Actinomycetota bacterium]